MKTSHPGILLLFALLLGAANGCRESPERNGTGPEAAGRFEHLVYSSATQIRTSTRDTDQFSRHVERELELKLLYAESAALRADPARAGKFRIDSLKSRSQVYFRYAVAMGDSERTCYASRPEGTFTDVPEALAYFTDHLRRRTDCLFALLDKSRLDSLLRARPDLRAPVDTCRGDCLVDAKSAFALSPEPILEALFGDSINQASRQAWAGLKARETIRIAGKIGRKDLEGDSGRILAYRGDRPFLTSGQMREFLKLLPQDSAYRDRPADYVDIIGIWTLGAEEFERLGLRKHPAIQAQVSRKDEEFWANEYRDHYFHAESARSKAGWNAWVTGDGKEGILPCQARARTYSPMGYHLLGLLPKEFLAANLGAGLVEIDSSRPVELQCREELERVNNDAYEILKAELLDRLGAKHKGIAAGYSGYRQHFTGFADTLDYLHAKFREERFGLVAQTLQALSLRYFSDKAKFTEISIFQARLAIQSGEYRSAAFYLERALQLYPADPSLENPLRLLLALYKQDYRNEKRSVHWKSRYKEVLAI